MMKQFARVVTYWFLISSKSLIRWEEMILKSTVIHKRLVSQHYEIITLLLGTQKWWESSQCGSLIPKELSYDKCCKSGEGMNGTFVFRGTYCDEAVAVKSESFKISTKTKRNQTSPICVGSAAAWAKRELYYENLITKILLNGNIRSEIPSDFRYISF